jgi:endonuclease YncB( thermonuclease family)
MPTFAFFWLSCLTVAASWANTTTTLEFNGVETTVSFNDGDTFRIADGKYKGTSNRTEGYNALESYGPVHQWGTWTAQELYGLSTEAKIVAQGGGWHCSSDMKKDTYGRTLAVCPDLVAALLSRGLAHVMTVDKKPAPAALIRLQQGAIKAKNGMWAKGVPEFILTSVHSADEKGLENGAYNRMVSTSDGHSEVVKHNHVYTDCTVVKSALRDFDISSLLYVEFAHRYGAHRAACLR